MHADALLKFLVCPHKHHSSFLENLKKKKCLKILGEHTTSTAALSEKCADKLTLVLFCVALRF